MTFGLFRLESIAESSAPDVYRLESVDSRFERPDMPANDIESEAARWLIRLEGDPPAQTRAEFDAWLNADPRNQAAFIRLERTWNRADALRRLRPLDGVVDEQVLDKFGVQTPIFDDPPERKFPRGWIGVATSILLAAIAATAWFAVERSGWQVYKTEFGGFQRIVLPDGSAAMLNTNSRIRVKMTAARRQILLDKGEALFTVAHDTQRPFDVSAADTVVRAVGTAFSVRLREQQQVDVIVSEGRVAIDPPEDTQNAKPPEPAPIPTLSTLSAGETVSVKSHRIQAKKRIADEDITRKLAWTQGRIWFDRVTLAEAVAEFNRYNRRQLVIDDPSIARLRIGGAFDATDLDSFIAALEAFGIRTLDAQSGPAGTIQPSLHLIHSDLK